MGLLETALILVSASLFGIAHIGWGPWKVLPTFVSGLLLGYLFVRVGVHASIAVHFLIDYSSFLWEVSPFAAQFYWIFSIVLLVLLVMGALSMGILVNKALMRSSGASFRGRALWATAAVHSFGAVIFALLIGPGQILIFTTMLCLPLAYIAWYAFKKGGLPTVGRAILLFMSVTTLVLAPLGVAFVMADADGEMSQ